MAALIAFIPFGLEYHLFVTHRANDSGACPHITALQAVVEPAVFVNIQKNVAAAAGTAFGFPFRHINHSMFEPGKYVQDSRAYNR